MSNIAHRTINDGYFFTSAKLEELKNKIKDKKNSSVKVKAKITSAEVVSKNVKKSSYW